MNASIIPIPSFPPPLAAFSDPKYRIHPMVYQWFRELDPADFEWDVKHTYAYYLSEAVKAGLEIKTKFFWHSGEGWCEDTGAESVYVETAFGVQELMERPEERFGMEKYGKKFKFSDIEAWYDTEKYTEAYLKKKIDELKKDMAWMKAKGFHPLMWDNDWVKDEYRISKHQQKFLVEEELLAWYRKKYGVTDPALKPKIEMFKIEPIYDYCKN